MVTETQQRFPGMPLLVGDAHHLPCRRGAVDLVVLITTLEFPEQPVVALAEAARVARQGLVLSVLNRWSPGGLSRRWGAQARAVAGAGAGLLGDGSAGHGAAGDGRATPTDILDQYSIS